VADLLTHEQRASWQEDGWCILRRAVPSGDLSAAQRAVSKLFPSAEEMALSRPGDVHDRWRTWDAPWPEFPFRSRSLNAVVVSDLMIELAAELLGTRDVRMYLAVVTAKYACQS
jgi:hypothetical protein